MNGKGAPGDDGARSKMAKIVYLILLTALR